MLQGLGGLVTDMAILRTCSLDPSHEAVIKSLMDFNQWKIETCKNEWIHWKTMTQIDKNNEDLKDINDSLVQEKAINDVFLDEQKS